MLVVIPDKHKKEWLRKWGRYELIDQKHAETETFKNKVKKTLGYLNEIKDGMGYVGISWGKDSVVCADLVSRIDKTIPLIFVKNYPVYNKYNDIVKYHYLKNHNQQYIEYYNNYIYLQTKYKKNEFIEKKERLWVKRLNEINKKYGKAVLGIRAQESKIRRMSLAIHGIETSRTIRPIIKWSVYDIFAYALIRNLPLHPNYAFYNTSSDRMDIRVDQIGLPDGMKIRLGFEKKNYLYEWYKYKEY